MKKIFILSFLLFNFLAFSQASTEEQKEARKKELLKKREQLLQERKAKLLEVNKEKKERIKALKVAYLSQKLNLTSIEAEKFWPVYNKYENKISDLQKQKIGLKKQTKKQLSNEEALKEIEASEKIEIDLASVRKNMKTELIPIIGAEKVLKLQKLEREFQLKLLEKIKERK